MFGPCYGIIFGVSAEFFSEVLSRLKELRVNFGLMESGTKFVGFCSCLGLLDFCFVLSVVC